MAYRSPSPSPNPTRLQSPRPRTPEPTIGSRKYSVANPSPNSTICRSLPDMYQRTSSSCTKWTRDSFDQKENERGSSGSSVLKQTSSPSAPSSKGAKNFMSPTFSAMSKITSTSSKRRILVERNDAAVKSSLNLISDADISDMFDKAEHKKTDICSLVVPVQPRNSSDEAIPKSDGGSYNHKASDDCNFKRSDPDQLKVPQSSAPYSADLSQYDLEKNYLSPRPRFLHYKPNPRVELYRNRKGELFGQSYEKELEDCSSEEDSVTTGDTEDYEAEDEYERHVVERKPSHWSSRSLNRPRLVSLVLMVVAASLLIPAIDTPSLSSSQSMSIDQPFKKLYVPSFFKYPNQGGFLSRLVEKVARVYDDKAEVLQYLYANYLADVPVEQIGSFQVINSTVVVQEEGQGSCLEYISMDYLEEDFEDSAMKEDSDGKERAILDEIKAIEEYNQLHSSETTDQDEVNMQPEAVLVDENRKGGEVEEEDTTTIDLRSSFQIQQSSTFPIDEEHETQKSDSAQTDGVVEEEEEDTFSDGLQFEEDTYQGATTTYDGSESKEVFQSSTYQVSSISKHHSMGTLISVSSVIISFATVLLSFYLKQIQPSPADPNELSPLPKKVISSNLDGISQRRLPDQSPLYHNYLVDAQTMVESCGPETSSTNHNTTSNSQIWRKGNEEEILSYDRTVRRNSTASSTSYGSFTTYEKLPHIKGSKDEALTPVRRSSRLRSKFTSP